jgi:hypothetical protein
MFSELDIDVTEQRVKDHQPLSPDQTESRLGALVPKTAR